MVRPVAPLPAGPLELVLPSRRATRRLAAALGARLVKGDVVWLEGELGAGKTFFTRGLLRALGVPEAVPVTSPTFALMHEHEGRAGAIVHLDLYRLGDASELSELGLDEAFEGAIAVVEWGARFREAIPERSGVTVARHLPSSAGVGMPSRSGATHLIAPRGLEIELVHRDGEGRLARLRALDARGAELLAGLERRLP